MARTSGNPGWLWGLLVVAAVCVGVLTAAGGAWAQAPPAFSLTNTESALESPAGIKFISDGKLLAVADDAASYVHVFSVGATGVGAEVTGSPFSTVLDLPPPLGYDPWQLVFSPSGSLVATANWDDSVSVFRFDASGVLTRVPGSPVANQGPQVGGDYPYSLAFSPDGHLLVTANTNDAATRNDISVWTVDSNGTLHPAPNSPTSSGGMFPAWVAFSPDGKYLAVVNQNSKKITVFSVAADGTLTQVDSVSTGSDFPEAVDFSPSGDLLAASFFINVGKPGNTAPGAGAGTGRLGLYPFDPTTGKLGTLAPGPTEVGNPWEVAFDPSGGLLAAANASYPTILGYAVGDGTPTLTPLPGQPFPTGADAKFLDWDPNGRGLCNSNTDSGDLNCFTGTAEFEISKEADRSTVRIPQLLTYTITVHNPDTTNAMTGAVTDDLSHVLNHAKYQVGSAHADTGSVAVNTSSRTLSWSGTLTPGQTATITFSVRVKRHARGILVNRVTAPASTCVAPPSAPPHTVVDAAMPCVTQTPIVPPARRGADLSITKQASAPSVHPGGQVTYTLVVQNHGPASARPVISDPNPGGLFLQSAVPSQGTCTVNDAGVTCSIGPLRPGGSAQVQVMGTVPLDAAGKIVNVATVSSKQGDPHPHNNTASATVKVVQVPPVPPPKPPPPPPKPQAPAPDPGPQPVSDLVVVKHGPRTLRHGERATYRLTVTNKGPDRAADVRLTDTRTLPMRVISIHPSQGSCQTGPAISCNLGAIDEGGRATVTVTVIATTTGHQRNTASVMSPSWQPGKDTVSTVETRILRSRVPPPPRRRRRPVPPPPPRVTG